MHIWSHEIECVMNRLKFKLLFTEYFHFKQVNNGRIFILAKLLLYAWLSEGRHGEEKQIWEPKQMQILPHMMDK